MEQEKEITFKPVNKGLGFHPFSDGMPYAPVSKREPKAKSMQIEVPRAPEPATEIPQPAIAPPAPSLVQKPTVAEPNASQEIIQDLDAGPDILYVGKRVLAYLADTILNVGLCAGAFFAVLGYLGVEISYVFTTDILILGSAFLAVFNWALITAEEIAFGTTVGKRLFGLSISGGPAAILFRSIFSILSFGVLGLGLVWCLFDSKKRCWHDIVSEIQPEEFAEL